MQHSEVDPIVPGEASRSRGAGPATAERDCSAAEQEFGRAMLAYKQQSGRMFPTWSEVLEVLQSLGYPKAVKMSGI
jgi:hypothetical protein